MVARGSGRAAPPRRRRDSKLSIGLQCGAAHLRGRIATWPSSAWAWGALGRGVGSRTLARRLAEEPQQQVFLSALHALARRLVRLMLTLELAGVQGLAD